MLIGAVLTAGSGLAAVSADGVHFTRTELVFLAPTSALYPNALRTQSEDIIITAGLVAKQVTGPEKITKFASPDVTLVGLGVRDGWSLRLPDTGGQWATNFATQRLFLDIVGPSEERVREQQSALIEEVDQELEALQRERGVDPVNDITMITAPQSTTIYSVGVNKARALGMTAVLGIGATIAAVIFREYLRRRRRSGSSSEDATAEAVPEPVTAS
ncbi:hypothetical protein [Microbacterium aerolatum]|uniref:hypothetical protein n=1 Tax=Microbacterium aerolatum TaxID=153731 RepID=UPI001649F03A|nr:hypothetical protein [Microbacterium aerolatum]